MPSAGAVCAATEVKNGSRHLGPRLIESERIELDAHRNLGLFVDLMRAKANLALSGGPAAGRPRAWTQHSQTRSANGLAGFANSRW